MESTEMPNLGKLTPKRLFLQNDFLLNWLKLPPILGAWFTNIRCDIQEQFLFKISFGVIALPDQFATDVCPIDAFVAQRLQMLLHNKLIIFVLQLKKQS